MVKKSSLGSAKRFGTRYGKAVKEKVAAIEKVQRSLQKCPYCKAIKAKQQSPGIFVCKGCGAKFTSKAYSVQNG